VVGLLDYERLSAINGVCTAVNFGRVVFPNRSEHIDHMFYPQKVEPILNVLVGSEHQSCQTPRIKEKREYGTMTYPAAHKTVSPGFAQEVV
jgi:hypothetical protein